MFTVSWIDRIIQEERDMRKTSSVSRFEKKIMNVYNPVKSVPESDRKCTVYKSFSSASIDDNDDVKMTRLNTSEGAETM